MREGAFHLLPLYYLLGLSDLAREGIQHSGSYRFADHLYAGEPHGITAIGRWLDARLLSTPAAQAFRRRYRHAQDEVWHALRSFDAAAAPLRVLAVPCGLPRDIVELAHTLAREEPALLARIEYHGMDLDPEVLDLADAMTRESPLRSAHYTRGDALVAGDYPNATFHAVVSTGLGEFLTDDELMTFYANVYRVLAPGGTFYTSATAKDPRSEVLLRIAEIHTCYRSAEQIERLFGDGPWRTVTLHRDPTALQTFVAAVK